MPIEVSRDRENGAGKCAPNVLIKCRVRTRYKFPEIGLIGDVDVSILASPGKQISRHTIKIDHWREQDRAPGAEVLVDL